LALVLLVACSEATSPSTNVSAISSAPTALAIVPTATITAEVSIQASQPLTPAQAAPPVSLAIPAIDLSVTVVPMAWQVTEVEGERRAAWQVPEDAAGWHINSAGAGALGNVVISGHHRQGQHVFAALARGEVSVGQQILLTDAQGRVFVYKVSEVSQPIPALGATQAAQDQAVAYLETDNKLTENEAKLTLVTGWPEFSDTHYLFVVAAFSGILPQGSTALHVINRN
jgi:sortase (surface protein transpeptidase)